MSVGAVFGAVFRGAKPHDWVLAGVLTVLGVALMTLNALTTDAELALEIIAGEALHPMTTHSAWLIPGFTLTTVPLLWWRRSVLAVGVFITAAMFLHDLIFGWVTRCGAGLPIAFVLAFLGALACERATAWLVCGLSGVLAAAVLIVDATAGFGALPFAAAVILIVFGIGRATRQRGVLNQQLKQRDAELRQLRAERAALSVADDRAQLVRQLDELLQTRLDQLTAAAESARGLPPAQAKALLVAIENDSRQTMHDMRALVGLLRGGEVELAPTPTVAHLDALLTRHQAPQGLLTISGDPRALPATVELSAYRIVEYLVTALTDHTEVHVHFDEDTVELRIDGSVGRAGSLKAAVARARERAKLLGGSVEVKVTRGHAHVMAQLPVRA
ncbi:sensor histidine kinase [Actinokineospora sp. 24-640]